MMRIARKEDADTSKAIWITGGMSMETRNNVTAFHGNGEVAGTVCESRQKTKKL
jgi:hypothetical protein